MKTYAIAFSMSLVMASTSAGQEIDFGNQSEATRFLKQFRRSSTAEFINENTLRRDSSAFNGFGVNRTGGVPTNIASPSQAPPRRQSATFGVGNVGQSSKPFSAIMPEPTVSPYLALFNETLDENDALNYQQFVRPRIQQNQFNAQVARQAQTINRRLTGLSARNAYNPTGAQNVMPTGHAATFQNLSRFYPQASQRRR